MKTLTTNDVKEHELKTFVLLRVLTGEEPGLIR